MRNLPPCPSAPNGRWMEVGVRQREMPHLQGDNEESKVNKKVYNKEKNNETNETKRNI